MTGGGRLSPTMAAHVKHGIGGATARTLEALARRGLVEDASDRPGFYRMSELGHATRVALLHPLAPGWSGTTPERELCPHGYGYLWTRWEWCPARGGTEESSEPVILEVPCDCHECNCDGIGCQRPECAL